jgi:hypothetical protein
VADPGGFDRFFDMKIFWQEESSRLAPKLKMFGAHPLKIVAPKLKMLGAHPNMFCS